MNNNSLFLILQKMRTPFIVLISVYTISIIGLISIEGVDNDGNPYYMSIFDAFYFISYTATTIGFGETPYTFSYNQRIWVSMLIYLTVIGWFYSIGTLISLLQDRVLKKEIDKNKFIKQIKNLREDFFIILGYNSTTKKIIEKSLNKGYRVVVIEKDEDRVNELLLDSYTPIVPVLQADIQDPNALEIAGITSKYCKGLVSLFENDKLNLRIAITSKTINKKVPLAVKSTTENQSENLMDVGVEIVENPFHIISNQIDLSLNTPSIYQIEKWIYNMDNLLKQPLKLPRGLYIICGYGRMGKEIYKILQKNKIDARFIEIDKEKVDINKDNILVADADDKEILKNLDIEKASVIIAGTDDDTTNLSLLSTAKKLNKNIITIARENEIKNYSIFKYSNIDYIFMPSRILINKTINALVNPMSDKFLYLLKSQTEKFASDLIEKLLLTIGNHPELFELKINKKEAFAISTLIEKKENNITLKNLMTTRDEKKELNNIIALLLQRGKKFYLLPDNDMILEENDQILFAASSEAINDIEYIAQNSYELEYVLSYAYKS
ncbi:Trk K+ transport system NAD-binding subunit [Malaciobacter marinus]|uniref:Trk K+ transport system NAD-binding subunit n=1 Tax=Malaciobacter marinus TaxID=505249 RepID=A0AB36ZW26_9BACT|nr:potassium channel protein [Malaciobacter marinus]PPK60762.1 Trk K+ transport system NAD-binding subunit [Malaciobacter marinus]